MAATQIIFMVAILASVMTLTLSSHDHHHHHTKHVIHAPLHIKLIHHHKIIKVPVVMRKHLHHHKYVSHEHVYIPLKEKPKPVYVRESDHHQDEEHPAKVIIIKKAPAQVKYEIAEDSEGGDNSQGAGYGSRGHYRTEIGEDGAGHGNDRNEDYGSYEYEESRENSGYGNNLYH